MRSKDTGEGQVKKMIRNHDGLYVFLFLVLPATGDLTLPAPGLLRSPLLFCSRLTRGQDGSESAGVVPEFRREVVAVRGAAAKAVVAPSASPEPAV